MKRVRQWCGWAAIGMGIAGGAWAQPSSDDAALLKRAESLRAGDVIPGSYIVTFVPSTTQRRSPVVSIQEHERAHGKGATPPPFGEHSTGQDKAALAQTLGLRKGKVHRIFDLINAVHVLADADEAETLRKDSRVLVVEPDRVVAPAASPQDNPGWALDRMDQPSTTLNNKYNYVYNGAGQTIYVLDTGLNLGNSTVAAEFGGRAMIAYDFFWDGGETSAVPFGYDCHGHGTKVASAAAGATYGAAKGANVRVIRISANCSTGESSAGIIISALNYVANNASKGSIINLSYGDRSQPGNCTPMYDTGKENAVRGAYNKGMIVVIAAGNDGCDVNNFPLTRRPEAFVVGATRLVPGKDLRTSISRYGSNVAGFAPGYFVPALNYDGQPATTRYPDGTVVSGVSGTSLAAPYVAGLFASACHATGTYCQTAASTGELYQAFKNTAMMGSVFNPDGGALTGGTPSRFFIRNGW